MKQISSQVLQKPSLKALGISWCNEHGVNPMTVPLTARIEILDDEHLEIEVYDMTSAGLPQWDEANQRPKFRWLHVKCKYPFPEELLEDE